MHESVERYIRDLWEDYASGEAVPETSGYAALQNLLNDELALSVKTIVNIRNRGAGIPDGGLFTADQLRRRGNTANLQSGGPVGFPSQLPVLSK